MDSFPHKDLPAELSQLLYDAVREADPDAAPRPDLFKWYLEQTAPPVGQLTMAERIAGLATIWSEAKFGFAYWDQLPGHPWWDEQFHRFLPLVAAEQDDQSYYRHLLHFGSLLSDGHTGVILPRYMHDLAAEPPLRLRAVEGRVVVEEGEGLPPGSEILTVDGRPWQEVAEERKLLIQSSRADYTVAMAVRHLLLRGPAASPVSLTARTPDGEMRELRLERSVGLPARPPLLVRDLGDGIRHVEVNRMDTDETWQRFDEQFPDFAGVRGLILDLRWNGGGSSEVGWRILSRLLSEPARSSAMRLPAYLPTIRAWGLPQRWVALPGEVIQPHQTLPRFEGPVCFLSSPFTFSAAEDFLVVAKESRRGPVIGEPSGGSTGQPLMVPLPAGGLFRVCTKRDTYPDGTVFVGPGIQPDIACVPTLAGVRMGRDEVVERAVGYLRTCL